MKVWEDALNEGFESFCERVREKGGDAEHLRDTPERVVAAFMHKISGYGEDAGIHLRKTFTSKSATMVHVAPIRIDTTCAHHLMPIIGVAHFAYIPSAKLVGLSKIPRFIDVLCRRLQVQEDLGAEIVDTFQRVVNPSGCALWMKCYHCCMSTRGVYEHQALTKTMELRGVFRKNERTRMELMASIDQHCLVIA